MKKSKVIIGVIASILVLLIAQIGASLIGSLFHEIGLEMGASNIIAGILYLLFAYLLLKVISKKFLKIDLPSLRIPRFNIQLKWLIVAILLPVVVIGIFLLLPGEFKSSGMSNYKIYVTLSGGIFFSGMAAGFVEEMVFRGVIMSLLKERWNTKVAVIVPSVLFGVVHLIGIDFSLLSCILVILAGTMVGIMFSLIALESNSIWNSGIVHAIWNMLIIGGAISIGEKVDEYSAITYVLKSKSFALTGGEFGIESSVIGLAGYVIVSLIAYRMIKNKGAI